MGNREYWGRQQHWIQWTQGRGWGGCRGEREGRDRLVPGTWVTHPLVSRTQKACAYL